MDSILLHHDDLLVCLANSKSLRGIDAEAIVTESKFKLKRNIDVTGWAWVPVHKHTRFTTKQKDFLHEEFIVGEVTGRKTTPEKVLFKMRTIKDKKCVKSFSPIKYLSRQQILSSFSKMSKQYRQGLKSLNKLKLSRT